MHKTNAQSYQWYKEQSYRFLIRFCLVIAGIHLINTVLFGGDFDVLFSPHLQFSLGPRALATVPAIVTASLFHGNWNHLFNNIFTLGFFGHVLTVHAPRLCRRLVFHGIWGPGLFLWLTIPELAGTTINRALGASDIGAAVWGALAVVLCYVGYQSGNNAYYFLAGFLVLMMTPDLVQYLNPTEGNRIFVYGHLVGFCFGLIMGVAAVVRQRKTPHLPL